MDSARKIELQATEDLAYLVANVRRAAAARIDEAFPPVENDDGRTPDELRTRIEELVNEYIIQTFTLASPNLSINGLPVDSSQFFPGGSSSSKNGSNPLTNPSEPEEVFEPFDGRKRARVEALTTEEEDLLRDIARLKRGVPGSVAASWAEAARAAVRADEEALERVNGITTGPSESGGGGNDTTTTVPTADNVLTITPLERQADVEAGFDNAVRGLARLKKEMPAVVARMERARKAGEYVVTSERS